MGWREFSLESSDRPLNENKAFDIRALRGLLNWPLKINPFENTKAEAKTIPKMKQKVNELT